MTLIDEKNTIFNYIFLEKYRILYLSKNLENESIFNLRLKFK